MNRTPIEGVAVTLDRPRTLKYDFRSVRELEKVTGRNLLLGELLRFKSLDDILVALAVGLKHEDATVTPETLADAIDLRDIVDVVKSLNEALSQALPKAKPAAVVPFPASQVQ